jgi:hypothetical protein
MRDIRSDLQQRARLIEDEISAAYNQFEQRLVQLQAERDGRVGDLQSELAALNTLIDSEHRRMVGEADRSRMPNEFDQRPMQADQPLQLAQPAPQARIQGEQLALPQPQPQFSLADFILHKLNERGPLSKDDLVNLSLQEGVFADPESADHGIHGTLVSVIRSEHIRQLHDGTFVPNTLPQALRMRRAV